MNDKMNKTSICSIVALDIIDYSKKIESEQAEIKNQLDGLINLAVINISQTDCVIIDTGQGAVIACSGPLENALFISLTIRDEILKNNIHSLKPWYVQFGINLGSARVANNKKDELDIIGDGVDEAKRIMSFAIPNQILVSRVYYEMASKLTQEISKMFEQYDMHAHEQELYAVRLFKDQVTTNKFADNSASAKWQLIASKINWMYAAGGLLVLAAFFVLSKQILAPTEPTITMDPPVIAETPKKPETKKPEPKQAAEPLQTAEPSQIAEPEQSAKPSEPEKTAQEEPKKTKVVQKKATQKAVVEAKALPTKASASNAEKPAASNSQKPVTSTTESHPSASVAAKTAESKTEKKAVHEKSGWQTFKDSVTSGSERKCTQAEIAMNQCAK